MTSALHILFRVGEAEYVLPAAQVDQMESFTGATPVPGSAPYVSGLMQIRGKVVPIVDLRRRFGLPPIAPTLDSRVVVARAGDRRVGLLVDRAREVLKLAEDQFRAPPEIVADQAQGFVRSVAQAGERLVMLIDFEKVIGEEVLNDGQT
ncbi:MAG: chemotaxis protein CheW [Myxococcaceae bacterium]